MLLRGLYRDYLRVKMASPKKFYNSFKGTS